MHAIAQELQHAKEGQWTRYVFNKVCDLAWCLSEAPCEKYDCHLPGQPDVTFGPASCKLSPACRMRFSMRRALRQQTVSAGMPMQCP